MKEECVIYHTTSAGETVDLGRQLGECLTRGDVISLAGELGSGKTWFTKGVGLGLGIAWDMVITSPSFSLVNEYEGRHTLFHLDAYRLESLADFLAAGLDEYFYQDGVVVMEWADRWPEILPDYRLKCEFVITDDHTRKITMSGYHPRSVEILKHMEKVGR
ncbi:MAG: tRNA (adenosine(37)-N6)-threonylcarbamoyltransferase complex ATPase subunit type 1 TsaE [Deltaproteobacteria bacterium]|nr:tRNA (adenosine(37)-N6)-threonylcarbamoyltransferase complex ATPase subunit type 1 TsaE [Deltaproteobacteria bacterium]MBW2117329.1 tRNA (adenosine(37)-N6)-threonylcarbamoyltransferase complex ATPase subunit type 1 TsaE [Deltaproteobacteria bacterium]MBW2342731.1 tRNA (adenosine(37)-N6)-threonylcarbamoyltransferase complex ATPase subunit type 1 TsaE [Deltaproteobacteria bacterium]